MSMGLKKVKRKLKVALKVFHEGGLLNFAALLLEFLAKYLRSVGRKYLKNDLTKSKGKIYTCVRYNDAIKADFHHPPTSKWTGSTKKSLVFNWIMPPPGKGSGGHLNIFRFIAYLEERGHTCRIYLYSQQGKSRISDILAIMGDSYPVLDASMEWLDEDSDMAPADGILATSWETAYASYNSKLQAKRFYFIQDFEPYFYPVGGLSTLAENTYKFGFYGVTAGGWLAKKLSRDYGMKTDSFDFGADEGIYPYLENGHRKEILFYARPYTERRGFELGIMALDLFHKKHPDYTINMVGFNVSNYDLPFPYKNLKTLEIHELSGLYNNCAAGLVLSFTNMSLLPLELLSCGTIPVVNDGENNRLVSNNKYIAYSASDPISLANKLSEIVTMANLTEYSKLASRSVSRSSWENAGEKFVDIIERETRHHE